MARDIPTYSFWLVFYDTEKWGQHIFGSNQKLWNTGVMDGITNDRILGCQLFILQLVLRDREGKTT